VLGPYARGVLTALTGRRDLAYAVGIAVLGEAELLSGEQYNHKPVWPGPQWLNALLILVMAAPVVLRRVRPLTSALGVFGVGSVMSLALGAPEAATAFVVLVATTFAGAAYSRHWWAVVGGVAVLCATHAVNDPSSEGAQDLFWVFGLAGVSLLLGRAVWARQHRIASLEDDIRVVEARQARLLAEATAAERAAIAREMHDLVSHAVSVIVIQAQAGARALPARPDTAKESLLSIEASARTAMTELRRLLVLLDDGAQASTSPAVSLDQVPELVQRCRTAGLQLRSEIPARWPSVSPSTGAVGYHVVREALTNAMRHAPGGEVHLVIAQRGDGLEICVTDSGAAGDRTVETAAGAGRGLIGLRERVALVGGSVDVGPYGDGFRLSTTLPLGDPTTSL
jgi:signal transduction histidine kinase